MGFVILCIFCSTIILSVFKLATRLKLDIFRIILINYLIASILGLIFSLPLSYSINQIIQVLPWASIIGTLFILIFFLVGKTTAVSGMAITSIASKMSVVVPALFSIIYYNEPSGKLKYLGMAMALIALFMAVYTKQTSGKGLLIWILPLVLFLGNGVLDSIVKFTQAEKLPDFDVYLFNTIVFSTALIIGLAMWPFKPRNQEQGFNNKSVVLGVILGVVNFGSLYAMVMALGSNIDSSVVFLINNTGIVVFASLIGVFVFNERISRINTFGIILAVLSIFLLSIQY